MKVKTLPKFWLKSLGTLQTIKDCYVVVRPFKWYYNLYLGKEYLLDRYKDTIVLNLIMTKKQIFISYYKPLTYEFKIDVYEVV